MSEDDEEDDDDNDVDDEEGYDDAYLRILDVFVMPPFYHRKIASSPARYRQTGHTTRRNPRCVASPTPCDRFAAQFDNDICRAVPATGGDTGAKDQEREQERGFIKKGMKKILGPMFDFTLHLISI